MPKRGGGKRRKKRTHQVVEAENDTDGVPRSLVIARGRVPQAVRDLISDIRSAFMPNTAQKLRERKSNTLRDYVSVASSLHVTHIWMFSATATSPYLRVGRLPQGPTLTFRVREYTLASDVRATQRRPMVLGPPDMATAPLLVLNNFKGDATVNLMGETLRHCFPSIDVNTLRLSSVRRVLLIERDTEDGTLRLRHYALKVQPSGLSRPVRKMVLKGRVPKLGGMDDVAELIENDAGAFSSDSEAEGAGEEVTLSQDVKRAKRGAASKVRLVEVGPRVTLELVKVESGLCDGPVLFHKFVKKSKEEAEADQKRIEDRERLKKKRRADQEANVRRKEEVKRARKERRKQRLEARTAEAEQAAGDEGDVESGAEADSE